MVLVTGFEPFGDVQVNTSALIARELDGSVVTGRLVRSAVLPVSYHRVKPMLEELLRGEKEMVLLLGLAATSPYVRVEAVALNVAHSLRPDNDGYAPRGEPIYKGAPLALMTGIDVAKVAEAMRAEGIPAWESYHAGTYLCNYAYYVALYKARCPALFLHVPNALEAVSGGPPRPSLPLSMLVKAAKIAINLGLGGARP